MEGIAGGDVEHVSARFARHSVVEGKAEGGSDRGDVDNEWVDVVSGGVMCAGCARLGFRLAGFLRGVGAAVRQALFCVALTSSLPYGADRLDSLGGPESGTSSPRVVD